MNQLEETTKSASEFRFGHAKRKHRRMKFTGFVGDLGDGKLAVGGKVLDVSIGGFKITDIPSSFVFAQHTYTAIVSGGGKHYRLLAKPCWKKHGGSKADVTVGFKILDAPWEWVEFAMKEIEELDYEDSFVFHA